MNFREYILQDVRMDYYRPVSKESFLDWLLQTEQYHIRKFVRLLRAEEYYTFERKSVLMRMYYARRKNRLGVKLGFFIPAGCFGTNLKIAHYGSIIVNPHARIGSGCTIHGNCCIGNKGLEPSDNDSPVIGNDVNIGQGAQILGNVRVADGVKVGAGAVVINSVSQQGAVIAGVPASQLSIR